jgi:hypothetical protein
MLCQGAIDPFLREIEHRLEPPVEKRLARALVDCFPRVALLAARTCPAQSKALP